MRRVAFVTMAALCAAAAFGQGLLDCMDPDVLRTLLMQGQGQQLPVITVAVPAELSALKMPREFAWIGSAERITGKVDATTSASQVTAAWRTSLAPDAAQAATATALTASGWEVWPRSGAGLDVFRTPAMQTWQDACRDGKPVNFTAGAMDGVTYVRFTIQRNSNYNSACSQRAMSARAYATGLEKYMPHLEMPVDPATGMAARSRGNGTSSADGVVTAEAEFALKDSVGNVAGNFAKQMTGQGWTPDANWSGATTAGSSWSKRDAGALIQSTLSVTAVDDQQFTAALRVIKLQ